MGLIRGISKLNIFVYVFCLTIVFGFDTARAAGALDQTFGTGGRVVTPSPPFGDDVQDIAVQADGKIVVVGEASNANNRQDTFIARYNADGTLDTTFDGDGKVIVAIGNGYDAAFAVAIQPDGKIVTVGISTTGTRYDITLVRVNPNGSFDTSFDGDGLVITAIFQDEDFAYGIALQPDGKILIGGYTIDTNLRQLFAVVRYNPNGSLDTSFDGDGIVTTFMRPTTGGDSLRDVLVQPDGKIVAAGESYAGINQDFDFALLRYNADGSLDTTFDGDGKLTTPVSTTTSPDGISSIALQSDGKIVAAGYAYAAPNNNDCVLARYNVDGSLDTSFDTDGKLYFSFGNLTEFLSDVKIQPDGKIVAAGHRNNGSSPTGTTGDFALVRLNPNGSFDTTFDTDGKLTTAIGNGSSGAFSLALQPNGKILAAGYTALVDSNDANVAVVRYMGDVNTADFDGDTRTDISIFRPSNGQWWFLNSSNNAISALTFGVGSDKIVTGDYTGDGKTDVAVWRSSTGEWFILRSEDFSYYAFAFGANGDTPAPADFDGDGRTDAAVFRPSTGVWYILSSNGGTIIRNFGANGDKPIPSDFDGDGKADLAIFRPLASPSGQWWYLKSSDSQLVSTVFGNNFDTPVPADYTGDGKADIAFWRAAIGRWYVLKSEDYATTLSTAFGTDGDLPAPADYDGDGRTDVAVFRPTDGTWYVQRTTAGTLTKQFGANGDKPVSGAFVP
jgi:uncharacterized delta-60 repeat protein